jgi:predicted  nucleic acid-binding Zn-ribbon protein
MTIEQRIAAITAALTAVEHSIAQTEAALRLAMTLNDIARLNRDLVTLKAKRTQLQFELMNLQAAQTAIAPMAAGAGAAAAAPAPVKLSSAQTKNARAIAKQLNESTEDRRMIEAARQHSEDVLRQVSSLQTLLSGQVLADE